MEVRSIGKNEAVRLFESKWWENFNSRQIAVFQLFTRELCCEFGAFHGAVEAALGRPVWTHQLGSGGAEKLRRDLHATDEEYDQVKNAITERTQ